MPGPRGGEGAGLQGVGEAVEEGGAAGEGGE